MRSRTRAQISQRTIVPLLFKTFVEIKVVADITQRYIDIDKLYKEKSDLFGLYARNIKRKLQPPNVDSDLFNPYRKGHPGGYQECVQLSQPECTKLGEKVNLSQELDGFRSLLVAYKEDHIAYAAQYGR